MKTLPLLLALSGCFYANDGRFHDQVEDADGDGGVGVRFDGPDCVDDDPDIADCDIDGDGYLTTEAGGDDCDDEDASAVPGTFWFHDVDGDGFGDPDDFTSGCGPAPAGWSLSDADCDDANASVNPGADERCDPLDRNCDGDPIGLSADAAVAVYVDADEDGYGKSGTSSYLVCAPSRGEALQAGDCDDAAPTVSPGDDEIYYDSVDQDCDPQNENDADEDGEDDVDHGGDDCDDTRDDVNPDAQEVCDGVDNDCDGAVDADDPDQSAEALFTFHLDADGDGFGGDTTAQFCIGGAPPDYALSGSDCNDASDAMHPGAVEWCNGVDDNCNGVTDEGTAVDAFTAYFDNDQDGWGGQGLTVCTIAPLDYDGDAQIDVLTLRGGDCGNNDPDVYPGAKELCGDSIRQDCTTADPDDCDSDGFLANAATAPDCDDDPAVGGSAVHPGQKEVCDGLDNDCDGKLDAADPDVLPTSYPDWYLDSDHDGHGSAVTVATKTCSPPVNAASVADDCDDLRSSVHPDAPERCDGYDNDCNSAIDDDPIDLVVLYEDLDDDGFGAQYSEERCAGEPGWTKAPGDCDDSDAATSPAADELCSDLVDNDCDALVDGLDPSVAAEDIWYPDDDGDGFGAGIGLASCEDPSTVTQVYVPVNGDCDDSTIAERGPSLWFADQDNDTFGGTLAVQYGCHPPGPVAWLQFANDCNDATDAVHPGADELCNLRDDDCDGTLDDDPPPTAPGVRSFYSDADNDGWGVAPAVASCFDTGGVSQLGDCDESNPARNPGTKETCNDALDNDCDGQVDEDCTVTTCNGWSWPSRDGDSFGSMVDDPVAGCNGAALPEDCDDNTSGAGAQVWNATPLDDLAATINSQNGCLIVHLSSGNYPLSQALAPKMNAKIAIVGDVSNIVLEAAPGMRAIDVNSTGANLVVQNVRISGNHAQPRTDLAHVNTGARLVLVGTSVDGQDQDAGIFAQGGTLGLFGSLLEHTAGSTTEGTALAVNPGVDLRVNKLEVRECTMGTMLSSVVVDASTSQTFGGVTMLRSKQLAFVNGSPSALISLNDVAVWDAVGDGIYYQNITSDLSVNRLLIARASDLGIDAFGATGDITLKNVTILKSAQQGVLSAGTVNGVDSVIYDNGALKDVTAQLGGNLEHSYVPRLGLTMTATNALASPPLFVTYNKGLRSKIPGVPSPQQELELWDLHLRTNSPGKGNLVFPEDIGYYPKSDPYYADTLGGADNVPDGWEQRWFGGDAPLGDADGDGVSNGLEYDAGTCPQSNDTDGDAKPDPADPAPLDPTVQ